MRKVTNVLILLCSLLFIFSLRIHARKQGLFGINTVNKRKLDELVVEILPQEGMKENDRITELPGQPKTSNSLVQYGGYVTVNKVVGRALFYYFVEASIKDSAPLILWLNGGPGCSSFGYGAMQELGPFRVKSDGKTLYENIYAWNKVANVIFLESPVGVGYSYSNTSTDVEANTDERAAEDSYIFLLNWLERFPEYKNRDFYITGESYAGHYIPQLSNIIIEKNKLGNTNTTFIINLKGIAIGNGNLDDEAQERGRYEYLWSHGLVSDSDMDIIRKECDFSVLLGERGEKCLIPSVDVISPFADKILNPYNLYAPMCTSGLTTIPKEITSFTVFDPCNEIYVANYLNLPEVQLALHANVTKLPYPWQLCRVEANYIMNRETIGPSMVLPLQNLVNNKIRVLLYSGDFDGLIPFTSTKFVLKKLNLTEQVPWTPWNVSNEVAGYSVQYEGDLTFTTIRGAGHEVPSYQPERAFVMIKSFLNNETFPLFPPPDFGEDVLNDDTFPAFPPSDSEENV